MDRDIIKVYKGATAGSRGLQNPEEKEWRLHLQRKGLLCYLYVGLRCAADSIQLTNDL